MRLPTYIHSGITFVTFAIFFFSKIPPSPSFLTRLAKYTPVVSADGWLGRS